MDVQIRTKNIIDNGIQTMVLTFKTSKVIAFIARHIIPSVSILGTKSMDTVLVFPVVGLLRSSESKITDFFVCPQK